MKETGQFHHVDLTRSPFNLPPSRQTFRDAQLSSMNAKQLCKICGEPADAYAEIMVRDTHLSRLHSCPNCGFVFIEPVYWLDEAYEEVIAPLDVGYVWRNLASMQFLSAILNSTTQTSDFFVDFGGGYGLLVRLMRDKGFRFHLHEPHAANLFARNCEADRARFGPYRALTAIEVFEHLIDPRISIAEMVGWSQCILFTTELCPVSRPMPEDWWYFALEHGQHVSFYTVKSLELLGAKHNLDYVYLGNSWHILASANDAIIVELKPKQRSVAERLALRMRNRSPVGNIRQGLLDHDFHAVKGIIQMDSKVSGKSTRNVDDI